jgi:hypothetical protein
VSIQGVYIKRWDFNEVFMFHVFLNKRSEGGGAVGVVLIQFSKRFRPVAENGNKQRHLQSPSRARTFVKSPKFTIIQTKSQFQTIKSQHT